MPMTVAVAQARLQREVPAAEQALDEALLRLNELMHTLLVARQETGVAAHAGQKALLRLAQSQQDLLSASSNMLRTHEELVSLARATCAPDENYCPESNEAVDEFRKGAVRAA